MADCGTAQPTTLEVHTNIPVQPGILTSNAVLRGTGTARLVLTELDSSGREVASTLTEPVEIGGEGLNYLRHKQSDVRLHDETRSVRIAVRADSSTRLQVDALTAAVR